MAEQKNPPPYGTYGMLKATVERFDGAVVPTSLNRHVLSDLSGGDYNALGTTLRFFGFIDENRVVQQDFRDLVDARQKDEQYYKDLLLSQLEHAYKPIVGDLDITRGTLPDLERKFKDYGVPQGDMLIKTIRFYVKALEDCGAKVSDFITKPRPRNPNKNKGTKTKKKDRAKTNGADAAKREADTPETPSRQTTIPSGFQRIAIPSNSNAFVQFPMEITVTECDQFEGIMSMLRTFAGIREKGGPP